MTTDVDELGGDRILVHRHSDAAQARRRQLRPIEPRAVVAITANLSPRGKPRARAPARNRAPRGNIRPGKSLPDAAVLFAHRRPAIVTASRRNSRGNITWLAIRQPPPYAWVVNRSRFRRRNSPRQPCAFAG